MFRAGLLLKSAPISTVFRALCSKLFLFHQAARCSTFFLYADPSPSEMNLMRVVRKLQEFDRRVARGAAVGVDEESRAQPQVLLVVFFRKSVIQPQVGSGPLSWDGVFLERSWGHGGECGAQARQQHPDVGARGVSAPEEEEESSTDLLAL